MAMDVLKFAKSRISLLNLERQVEIDESRALREHVDPKELQKKGLCLLKLRVRSQCTGLYGRFLVTFESNQPGSDGKLPSHSITPGDIVGLTSAGERDTEQSSGIVTRATQTVIVVAFEGSPDNVGSDAEGTFGLVKLANDVTYKRTKSALDALTKYRQGPAQHLIGVLFGHECPSPPLQALGGAEPKFFNRDLDESQQAAVTFALSQKEVAIIHGPPGTGKTTTVVEVILQAVRSLSMKVLACAPSNIAVDNMVEKLVRAKAKVVRLGHPARLLSVVQRHSLDALVSSSDSTSIVRDVRRDMDQALTKVRKARSPSERKQLYQELKFLRQELRQREDGAIKEILTNADVVLTTTTSASPEGPLKLLKEDHFDLVVIDEAAQALEASCWIPLLRAPRCVLAGDHLQLPPTIISSKAAKQGLEVTIMHRLLDLLGDKVVRMLTTQYRMHEAIMKWPSQQLYQGRLQAAASVRRHLLKDLPGVNDTDETSLPLLLIDTAGCDVYEMQVEEEVSKGNEGEADIVTAHVSALVDAGVCPSDIAVIAPYNLQVELLRQRLSSRYPVLEVNSVDGFQGREKEAVVISLVRSNEKGEVGFLSEDRRINVAITRARRHLAVVADSETVGRHEFLRSLIEYMSEEGEVRSALEYQNCFVVSGNVAELQKSDAAFYRRKDEPAKAKPERTPESNVSEKQGEFSDGRKSAEPINPTSRGNRRQSSTEQNRQTTPKHLLLSDANLRTSDDIPDDHDSASTEEADRPSCSVKSRTCDGLPNDHDCAQTQQTERPSRSDGKSRTCGDLPNDHDGASTQQTERPLCSDEKSRAYDDLPNKRDQARTSSVNDVDPEASRDPDNNPTKETNAALSSRRPVKEKTSGKSREELECEMRSFLVNKGKEKIVFPASLSAQERFFVHSIAEDLNLEHESKGEANDRHIVVSKRRQQREENDDLISTCTMCGKRLPTCNMQLHVLRCQQQRAPKPQPAKNSAGPGPDSKPQSAPIKKKKKPGSAQASKLDTAEDFDAMIAAFSKLDAECSYDGCKKSVRTVGQRCRCCDNMFCLSHHIPEVHGCGLAAKHQARQDACSSRPTRVDPARKANLQRKVDKKLAEMSGQRARKKKQGKT